MSDAPERLKLQKACGGGWSTFTNEYGTPYIREDIPAAETARLQARVAELEGAVRAVYNMGQTAVPDHWVFRDRTRHLMHEALKGGGQ